MLSPGETSHILIHFALLVAAMALSFSDLASAETRPVDCKLIVNGKSYIDGVCEFSNDNHHGSFSIYGGDAWAMVDVENGKGEAFWNEGEGASHAQSPLGEVHKKGGCWEGPTVRICALAIAPSRLAPITASRPKGLRLSPEYMDNLCVSAPGYRFVAGAMLAMDRCDHFWGIRQRVFRLSGGEVSFEGDPDLCIDARSSPGTKGQRLVLDECSRVAIRWIYDEDKKTIRSSGNLCWTWKEEMTVSPCEQNAEEGRRFDFGNE